METKNDKSHIFSWQPRKTSGRRGLWAVAADPPGPGLGHLGSRQASAALRHGISSAQRRGDRADTAETKSHGGFVGVFRREWIVMKKGISSDEKGN